MRSFDKFKRKMSLSGGSLKNENIKNSRELLNEVFADDASFTDNVYFWELGNETYDDDKQLLLRFYDRKYSAANGVTVKFHAPFDYPILVGDIVYDADADEYFICTEVFNIDDIQWQGKFTLCNWTLKWQNKHGDILEYPCYDINSTQYNSGEMSNAQFTIGSSQHMITLPYDENTVVLKTPQRFFLDRDAENPTSFIVTQNDTTSYAYGKKGLVKVTLMECATNNETDRIDLGICDYVEKDDVKTDNADKVFVSKSVISYDSDVIKSGGNMKTFTGKFFDRNGSVIDGVEPLWHIICDFKDALQIEESDNTISIGIDDDAYVDEDFRLVLSDMEGNYSSSLIIRIESLL